MTDREPHDPRCFMAHGSTEDYMAAVTVNVAKYGLHLVGVLSEPAMTYTVGLRPNTGFELLVFGLKPTIAAEILNDIGRQVRSGLTLKLNVADARFTNLPVKFMTCSARAQEVNEIARRYYSAAVPMVQMVLSDRAGRFPDEAGFDHGYMDMRQPLVLL